MLSLAFLLILLLSNVAIGASVITLAARWVGSKRARLSIGIAIAVATISLNLIAAIVARLLAGNRAEPAIVVSMLLFIIQVGIFFSFCKRGFALSTIRTFAPVFAYLVTGAVSLAFMLLVVRPHLFESFYLPTGGMSPTLQSGSRFITNKVLTVRRFDLVTYLNADPPSVFCQRIIGLPGERLRFVEGQLHVNDVTMPVPDVITGRCRMPRNQPIGRMKYRDGDTIQLGQDEYFLMGDNVEMSADSRIYGPVKAAALTGVVDLVYWPLSQARFIR